MADPYKELARMLESRQKKNMQYAVMGIGADLGTITSRMELKLDNFKHPIKSYLVSEHLMMDASFFTNVEPNSGGHAQYSGSGAHNHRVVTPKELKPLRPGDRVVVLPVNGGQEHVVVARVVPNA